MDVGSKTRERLAKADIGAQRAERRLEKEKEHSMRLLNTMEAIVRAMENDQRRYGQLLLSAGSPARTGGHLVLSSWWVGLSRSSSHEFAHRLPDHKLPEPLPTPSMALTKYTADGSH